MSEIALDIKNLSKQYRLGLVGVRTLSDDLKRFYYKIRGKEDPFRLVGDENDRTSVGGDYVWALRDINLSISKGEVVGIIGRNGAGKSTLLKILSQVTGPTEGSIKVKGRISSLLEVGTGFHPELTGKENVYLNGAILGMDRKEIAAKFDAIVDFAGIRKYIDTPTKRYSSGMKVRLGFAVAAFLEPDIMIVDEVLAVGDAEFQRKAIAKMREISKQKDRTVLFVSHNMNSIRNLCSRGVLLEMGQVKLDGDVDTIVSHYLSANSTSEDRSQIQRTGIGQIKITGMKILDDQEREIDQLISGDKISLQFAFENNDPTINSSEFIFSLQIRDEFGSPIASYISDEMKISFQGEKIPPTGIIVVDIPSLMLRGGKYIVKTRINLKETGFKHMQDEINNLGDLIVLPGDHWDVGKDNRTGHQALLEGSISIKENADSN